MFAFLRRTFAVLDRPARVRFLLFAVWSVVVAAIEAAGLSLIVPLTELLLGESVTGSGAVRAVTSVLHVDSPNQIRLVLAGLVLVALTVKAVAAILLLRWGIRNSLREEAEIARRLFARYLRAPLTYHLQHHTAEIQRTLNESLLIVFRRTLPFILAGAADAFTLVAIAIVMVISIRDVAGVALGYFAVVAVIYQRWIGGRNKLAATQAHQEIAARYKQVQEAMRATKELAVLHRQDHFVSGFYRTKLQLARAQSLLVFFQMLPRQFLDLAFVFGAALMAVYAFLTLPDAQALASIALFLTAGIRLATPLNRVMGAFTLARTATPPIKQVADDLAELESFHQEGGDPDGSPEEQSEGPRLGPATVELDAVAFAYGPDLPNVLDGVSLRIAPGDDVAVVGSTGAGKTTLLSIMLGLLEATTGSVRVNGTPMRKCRTAWQRSIGYVPQEIVLIDASVRENVAFGIAADEVDDERVREALRLAQVDGFVASLPERLDTHVGEHGVRLSGGQRQRLGLARALYHHPSVLVLDEATSSLDSDTEAKIMETIAALRGQLTLVTVAHRLSTLRHCDRIHYLRDGRISSTGTFAQLCAKEPEFARLAMLSDVSDVSDVDVPAAAGSEPRPGAA